MDTGMLYMILAVVIPLAILGLLRQVVTKPIPLKYNLRSVRARWQATLLSVISVGMVVMAFIILLAMVTGFRSSLRKTGSEANAIVTLRGSTAELTSAIERDELMRLAESRFVARSPTGAPLASPEVVLMANLPNKTTGERINVSFRGVTPTAFQVRNALKMVEGQNFKPGIEEIIVGKRLRDRIAGVTVGNKLRIAQREWTIAGIFDAEGSAFESEIWGDADVVRAAFRRENLYQSMTVRLTAPDALRDFAAEAGNSPGAQLDVAGEQKYYEALAGSTTKLLNALAGFVAVVMGIGAVFAAMNTMSSIIAARTSEISTLRVLGFSRLSILLAVIVESILIAIVGGLLGCVLALPVQGLTTSTGQTASFTEIAFAFELTPTLLAAGICFASLMGLLGGILPSARAARLHLASALRVNA